MPNNGREHATAFIQRTRELTEVGSAESRSLIVEATQDLILPAVQEDGDARRMVLGVSEWANRPFDEETLREYWANPYHPVTRLPTLDEETSLVLATGFLRATRELANPEVGSRIRDMLRSPGDHRQTVQDRLAGLESNFKSALLLESARVANEDEQLRGQIERALGDLREIREPLRTIGISGEGREGSWFIGVAVACSLAAAWCVAAAAVTAVVIAGVIIANK